MICFIVTYCVTNHEVGTNLLGHSALILSKYDSETGQMEAIHIWGFYSLPRTENSATNWLVYILNNYCGLNYDIYGAHGIWRDEDYRYFLMGKGLAGRSFEVTKAQWHKICKRSKAMMEGQNAAIAEAVEALGLEPKLGKMASYAYEHKSKEIFVHEMGQAKSNKRSPRLKRFHIDLSWDAKGPKIHPESSTCKLVATEILKGVLLDEQINIITENNQHKNCPHLSNDLEYMYLFGKGEYSTYTNSKGKTQFCHARETPGVKVFWTVPPQLISLIHTELKPLFSLEPKKATELKLIARKLQGLERLFRNSDDATKYTELNESLVNLIEKIFPYCLEYSSEEDKPTVSRFFRPEKKKVPVFEQEVNELLDRIQQMELNEEDTISRDEILETDLGDCIYSRYGSIFRFL